MDFFNSINSSKESELAYARWYSQLPDSRKAKMFSDVFQFGIDSVKYNAKKDNPFITESEALFKYIELNLKDQFTPEVFDFIRMKMQERAEEEWKQRFRKVKERLGWTYEEMAAYMGGTSPQALKSSISRKLPAFAKLAVCMFEQLESDKPEN